MTDKRPEISVVVPAFNRAKLIGRCVISLLEQDVTVPYEIVVVDDGSTDGTAEVARAIAASVRVVRQSNEGAAAARHRGIHEARGRIVSFQDSDDVARPNKLSTLYQGLMSTSEAVCACAQVDGMGEATRQPNDAKCQFDAFWHGPRDGSIILLPNALELMIRRGKPICSGMNFATYRDVALRCSSERSFYRAANDFDLQLRIAAHGPFLAIRSATTIVELQPGGISCKRKGMARYRAAYILCAACDAMELRSEDLGVRAALRDLVERRGTTALCRAYLAGERRLFWRTVGILSKYHRISLLPRSLWRTLDRIGRDKEPLPFVLRSACALQRWFDSLRVDQKTSIGSETVR